MLEAPTRSGSRAFKGDGRIIVHYNYQVFVSFFAGEGVETKTHTRLFAFGVLVLVLLLLLLLLGGWRYEFVFRSLFCFLFGVVVIRHGAKGSDEKWS